MTLTLSSPPFHQEAPQNTARSLLTCTTTAHVTTPSLLVHTTMEHVTTPSLPVSQMLVRASGAASSFAHAHLPSWMTRAVARGEGRGTE